MATKERELAQINGEINQLSGIQENYNTVKRQLDLTRHELNLIKQRLQQSTHHRQQEEVNNLKIQIGELYIFLTFFVFQKKNHTAAVKLKMNRF